MADGDINRIYDRVNVAYVRYLDSKTPLTQIFANTGGSNNFVGNLSGASSTAFIQPPSGSQWTILGVHHELIDTTKFAVLKFGGRDALVNGIFMRITSGSGASLIFENSARIYDNASLGRTATKVEHMNFGTDGEAILSEWKFEELFGAPIVLDGDKAERLEVLLNDDFTGLDENYFIAHGFLGSVPEVN